MKPYELMFILDPTTVADDAVDGYIERVSNLIVQNGGQVTGIDKWGRRRFAYEIKGRTEGYYVVMTFKATREVVAEVTRVLGLTDGVVRHLVVRLEREPKATQQPSDASKGEAAPVEAETAQGPEQAAAESDGAEPGETVAAPAAETAN